MTAEQRTRKVTLAFSPDPTLLGVVRGAIFFAAQQSHLGEAAAMNLSNAVEQACRVLIRERSAADNEESVQLELDVFADRLEVLFEEGELGADFEASPDAFLLQRSVDRIVQDETPAGGRRLTLVKYRQPAASR